MPQKREMGRMIMIMMKQQKMMIRMMMKVNMMIKTKHLSKKNSCEGYCSLIGTAMIQKKGCISVHNFNRIENLRITS